MKIVHLLKHSVRGAGNVHVAVDLACEQALAGHDVTFVSARGSYDELLAKHGVHVEVLPETDSVLGAVRNALALTAILRHLRPDVLHAHMMSSAVVGFVVARLVRAPLVTTVHNSFDSHSRLMRLGTVVIAVSEAERELLISRGFAARKVVTILNGPDGSAREALDGEDLGPLPGPSVTVLSGLHRRKAVGDVIAAFAEVSPDFPHWHLNVVGWGADRDRLEEQAVALGVGSSVHFLGSTLKPRPLLDSSAIFATATLADPCPLTVGEARAAGCAVVATAVGGIPELLDHGRAGLLVPPATPLAMAQAFRTLMADPAELATWQRRAREGAEHLSVRRLAADHERVYESVLTRRPSRLAGYGGRGVPASRVRVGYFVPPSKHFAGIERVVHEIASGLVELHGDILDVHVVYASHYDSELIEAAPYTCHVLGVARLRQLAGALRSCVQAQRFDVLVCAQVEASTIAWLATRALGLPIFVPHLHGNPRVEESEGVMTTKLAFLAFRHLVSRRSAGVLAVSPSLADYASRTIARTVDVHFAKNPVRTLEHLGHEPTTRDERFRFVSVARLSRQKGQDVLLRALAHARPEIPAASLVLVGTGPEEDALQALSTELGLDDVVEFVGYAVDPAQHLRSADCFVLASRWEGFGVALVEALQFGLPLLATDCDFGPADIMTDPRLGELVPAEDADALAAGLVRAVTRGSGSVDDVEFRRGAALAYDRRAATDSQVAALRSIVAGHLPTSERLAPLR